MADPCIEDTASVNLEVNVDDELQAFVIPAAAGTIDVASGVAVRYGASSGFTTNANGLLVDVQSPGLAIDANGIAKIFSASGTGWGPGGADDTIAHDFPIARGSSTVIGSSAFTITMSVAQSIQTRVLFNAYASYRLRTTYSDFAEPTNVLDETGVQLQTNYDGGGWVTADRYELSGNRQQVTANLKGFRSVLMEDGTSHTMQVRSVVTGGILSATAIQGRLTRSWYRGVTAYW